jgi:hypothetical protein
MRAGLVLAVLVIGQRGAAAETRTDSDAALAIELPALIVSGVALQAEHRLGMRRYSVAVTAGARLAAQGDYDSATVAAGGELRWWPFRVMRGMHGVARLHFSYTSVSRMSEAIGGAIGIAEAIGVGYRWRVYSQIEVTPTFTIGLHTDVDPSGTLPPWTRFDLSLGLNLGWRFRGD